MLAILLSAGCFTICALADKYAVSTAKLTGPQITFIMAFATSIFMAIMLPFMGLAFKSFSWQLVLLVALIALLKYAEFILAAKVLLEMKAFELKAWIGIVMFASYFTDAAFYDGTISFWGILFIVVTAVGLFMIAKGNNEQINYKRIVIPLVLYIISRFSYGVVMREGKPFGEPNQILFFALIVLSIAMLPSSKIISVYHEKRKGVLITAITKLPNAVGLFAESAALVASLTGYSLIQPIVLIVLFVIDFIKKEYVTKLNFAGAVLSVLGILGFQLLG